MKRARLLIAAVALALVALIGLQGSPVAAGPASAAPNCATLPARINSLNAEAAAYNREVGAINARGGGTPGQVAYYNARRARGIARAQALSGELAQCQSQGKLQDVKPPAAPGRQSSPPAVGRAPSTPNPTPGYPRPGSYAPNQGVARDIANLGGGRSVLFRDGGRADFYLLRGGRASGVSAQVSKGMLDKGSLSVSRGVGAVNPRGLDAKFSVRGHLLAGRLGGRGDDIRNIVALTPKANAQMRSIEDRAYRAIKGGKCARGEKLTYIVTPIYGTGPLGVLGNAPRPLQISMTARGCGLNIGKLINNG